MKVKAARGMLYAPNGSSVPVLAYWDEANPYDKRTVPDSAQSALVVHLHHCNHDSLGAKPLPEGFTVVLNPDLSTIELGR